MESARRPEEQKCPRGVFHNMRGPVNGSQLHPDKMLAHSRHFLRSFASMFSVVLCPVIIVSGVVDDLTYDSSMTYYTVTISWTCEVGVVLFVACSFLVVRFLVQYFYGSKSGSGQGWHTMRELALDLVLIAASAFVDDERPVCSWMECEMHLDREARFDADERIQLEAASEPLTAFMKFKSFVSRGSLQKNCYRAIQN